MSPCSISMVFLNFLEVQRREGKRGGRGGGEGKKRREEWRRRRGRDKREEWRGVRKRKGEKVGEKKHVCTYMYTCVCVYVCVCVCVFRTSSAAQCDVEKQL